MSGSKETISSGHTDYSEDDECNRDRDLQDANSHDSNCRYNLPQSFYLLKPRNQRPQRFDLTILFAEPCLRRLLHLGKARFAFRILLENDQQLRSHRSMLRRDSSGR